MDEIILHEILRINAIPLVGELVFVQGPNGYFSLPRVLFSFEVEEGQEFNYFIKKSSDGRRYFQLSKIEHQT